MDYKIIRLDGSVRFIHDEGEAVRDEDGRAIWMFGTTQDITARKQADAALEASEERLRLVLKGSSDGWWDRDIRSGTAYFSPRWMEMLGYAEGELPADSGLRERLTHPDDVDRVARLLEAARENGQAGFEVEFRLRHKDGRWVPVLSRGFILRDETGRPVRVSGVNTDITARKAAEAEIRALNLTLERRVRERTARLAAANKELESFSYSVSHDLRAPLRAISGFAAILGKRYRDSLDEKGRHYVDTIAAEGEHLGTLIEELLDYSRLGRRMVRAEPVPLGPLVAQLRATYGEQVAASGGTLEVIEPLAVPQADPVLLERILVNLVENALTYRRPDLAPHVTLSAVRRDGAVTLSVADNGIGIPPAYREKIFEVFTRLHGPEAYPGTGIGLSIVRRAARLMGSEISLESVEGEGSTFALTLPAAREPARPAAPPAGERASTAEPGDSGP